MKLGLSWAHKDQRLLYDYTDSGQPIPHFGPLCAPEPRPFIDLEQFGTEVDQPWTPSSNLLIRGDNLLALSTLAQRYAGKVKLIYIDPPFNTGIAFHEYDDGLEHSTWLTMMRDRLELLWKLLSPDGSLWCEIDDTQLGYLNVLLDEVFGRNNRIATVTVKRSAGTGHKAINPGPINVTDFVFGYARKKERWKYHPQLVLRQEYDNAYNLYIKEIDKAISRWSLEPLAEVAARSLKFKTATAARKVMGTPAFNKAKVDFALHNAKHVVRLAEPDYKSISKAAQAMVDASKAEPTTVFLLKRPNNPDMYFLRGQRILFLANKMTTDEEGEPGLAEKLTNFWDDIPWQGIAKEGGVEFKKNKKPERLLQRIIEIATKRGDLVVDSFAGSGTTGAVAHKMQRRWIMVEMGEHAETLALTRLKRVIAGEDASGVTKATGWQGGGGFRYLTLGAPFLQPDPELGLPIVNSNYVNGLLVAAVCLREGFSPTGDSWLHGIGSSNTYGHVTDQFVTPDYIELLLEQTADVLGDSGTVTLYCLHHDSDLKVPEHVRLRRIPMDLATEYCEALLE